MGLDMYINKVKKVGNLTVKEIQDIAAYIDWKKEDRSQYSFKSWCGTDENEVKTEYEDDVRKLFHIQKHPAWAWGDYENEYETVTDNVAYWRKANQIHNWFVENVQNGIDDCGDYLLTKEDVEELLHTTKLVLDSCELIDSKVTNGYRFDENGKEVPILEDGKVIVNANVAEELLPSTSGFFFGSTDYDQWYYEVLVNTVEQLEKILEETDFDKEYLFYHSSW